MSRVNIRISIATTDTTISAISAPAPSKPRASTTPGSALGHHEIFARFTFDREWDLTELSFAKFVAQISRENPDIVGLPVFCSRLFRFSSFYVNKKSRIKTVADLKGKRSAPPNGRILGCRLYARLDATTR